MTKQKLFSYSLVNDAIFYTQCRKKRQKKPDMLLNQQSKISEIKIVHRSQGSGSILRVKKKRGNTFLKYIVNS